MSRSRKKYTYTVVITGVDKGKYSVQCPAFPGLLKIFGEEIYCESPGRALMWVRYQIKEYLKHQFESCSPTIPLDKRVLVSKVSFSEAELMKELPTEPLDVDEIIGVKSKRKKGKKIQLCLPVCRISFKKKP